MRLTRQKMSQMVRAVFREEKVADIAVFDAVATKIEFIEGNSKSPICVARKYQLQLHLIEKQRSFKGITEREEHLCFLGWYTKYIGEIKTGECPQ